MRRSQPLEDLGEENPRQRGHRGGAQDCSRKRKKGPKKRRTGFGLRRDQEIRASLLGHSKKLILILGKMESCRKVLVRMSVIRFMGFVVILNHSGS